MEGLLMKRYIGLFVIAGMLLGAGVASADRAFWYNNNSGGWQTFFNIVNTAAQQDVTVEFFDIGGGSLSSTSTTLATNAQWNFSTVNIGNITESTLEAGTRGTVLITGGTAPGDVRGYASIFSNTGQSGFNLRIRTAVGDAGDVDW